MLAGKRLFVTKSYFFVLKNLRLEMCTACESLAETSEDFLHSSPQLTPNPP